jgi:hypothetical protein
MQVRNEVDLISVLFYLLVIRAVRYARLVPGWGPILMAVVSTLTDSAVLLYGGVLLVLTFGIGVAHQVALSSDNPYFSSVITSWENLFAMCTYFPLSLMQSIVKTILLLFLMCSFRSTVSNIFPILAAVHHIALFCAVVDFVSRFSQPYDWWVIT